MKQYGFIAGNGYDSERDMKSARAREDRLGEQIAEEQNAGVVHPSELSVDDELGRLREENAWLRDLVGYMRRELELTRTRRSLWDRLVGR